MKKTLTISSLVLAAGLTAGVILNQQTNQEPTAQALTFDGYVEPMTAPEAVETPEIVETPTVATQTVEVRTEPLNEVVEPIMSLPEVLEQVSSYLYSSGDIHKLLSLKFSIVSANLAVTNTYLKDSSKFTKDNIDNITAACVDQLANEISTSQLNNTIFDYRVFVCSI